MIILNVFLAIKSDEESNFISFAKDLVESSRAESGNAMYNLYKQIDGGCNYIILEHWKDNAAIESHNKTAHFQKFAAEIGNYVSGPVDIQKYEK